MNPPGNGNLARSDLFPRLLLICVLTVLYHLLYYRHGLVQLDEGVIFDSAIKMMRGEKWGEDFFAHYGLINHYLLALLFKIAGVSIAAERFLFIATRLPAMVLVYAIGRRLLPSWPATAVTLISILVPGHIVKSTVPLLLLTEIWLVFKWWETEHKRWILAASFWGAFSIWFRPNDIFVLLAVSSMSVFVGMRLKKSPAKQWLYNILIFLSGAGAGIVLLLPFFPGMLNYYLGILKWIELSIRTAEPFYAVPWPSPSYLRMNADKAATFLCLWATVAVYGIAGIYILLKIRSARTDRSWFYVFKLTLSGAGAFHIVVLVSNLAHLVQVAIPAYVLFAYIGYRGWQSSKQPILRGALALSFSAVMALYLIYCVALTGQPGLGSIKLLKLADTPVESDIGAVYTTDPPATPMSSVINYIKKHTRADDPIFCFPGCAIINALSSRPNPTPMNYFVPNFLYCIDPDIVSKTLKTVLSAKYFVYFERPTHIGSFRTPSMRAQNAPMRIYQVMERNFTIKKRFWLYLVLERGEDPTGATPVFLEGWEAYKYRENEKALEKLEKALDMGGPEEVILPLLAEVKARLNPP